MNPLLKDIFAEAKQIVELANKSSLKIGTAESCTGGLIGGAITAISGSSACFQGGIIAYDNAIKQSLLSVPLSTLDSYGAVSQQTAAEMADSRPEWRHSAKTCWHRLDWPRHKDPDTNTSF